MNLCRSCNRDFTGITNFDKHRPADMGACISPDSLGMTENEHGRWGYPGGFPDLSPPKPVVRPALIFDKTCVSCATIFGRPNKRGRPPTRCDPCRGK